MTTTAEDLFDSIAADQATSFESVGGEIVDAIKQDLSVPVQIITGPRGGRVVIRSKRGEHPRKETGKMQEEINAYVARDGANTYLFIQSPTEYSQYLDPPDKLNRPILTGAGDRFLEKVLDAASEAITTPA